MLKYGARWMLLCEIVFAAGVWMIMQVDFDRDTFPEFLTFMLAGVMLVSSFVGGTAIVVGEFDKREAHK